MSKSDLTTISQRPLAQGEKIKARPAWRLLRAEYSERRDITPDRWRLLSAAFETMGDEQLTAVVLEHMKAKPGLFPGVGDLWQQFKRLYPATPKQALAASLGRLGFEFIGEETRQPANPGGLDRPVYVFKHKGDGRLADIYH